MCILAGVHIEEQRSICSCTFESKTRLKAKKVRKGTTEYTCLYWHRFLISSTFFYLNIGYNVYDKSGGKTFLDYMHMQHILLSLSSLQVQFLLLPCSKPRQNWMIQQGNVPYHTSIGRYKNLASFCFFLLSINQEKSFAFIYLCLSDEITPFKTQTSSCKRELSAEKDYSFKQTTNEALFWFTLSGFSDPHQGLYKKNK